MVGINGHNNAIEIIHNHTLMLIHKHTLKDPFIGKQQDFRSHIPHSHALVARRTATGVSHHRRGAAEHALCTTTSATTQS